MRKSDEEVAREYHQSVVSDLVSENRTLREWRVKGLRRIEALRLEIASLRDDIAYIRNLASEGKTEEIVEYARLVMQKESAP